MFLITDLVLTTNQFEYIVGVIIKVGVVVNKEHVFSSNQIQDPVVLWFFGVWANANNNETDTSRLKIIKLLLP